jgi:hypothetical protein
VVQYLRACGLTPVAVLAAWHCRIQAQESGGERFLKKARRESPDAKKDEREGGVQEKGEGEKGKREGASPATR